MKITSRLFLAILLPACAMLRAQSDMELTEATVDSATIKAHIYFLTDDLLKGRETGTDGNEIAAAYLANMLRSYGVKPSPASGTYFQNVPLRKTFPPDTLQLHIGGQMATALAPLESMAMSYDGPAVYLGHGLEDDYKGKSVKGKLLLLKGGDASGQSLQNAWQLRGRKKALARENGAVGIVELVMADATLWGHVEQNFNAPKFILAGSGQDPAEVADFNYLWLLDENNSLANQLEEKGSTAVTFVSSAETTAEVDSRNVIGMVEGTDPVLKNEFIIYSAHYDHVGIGKPDMEGDSIYNGARDNAVGTTTVLSMAENLAEHPTKRSALFILFTAEEKGLLGSNYYVENPVLPLKQMVYCFNSDNGGYNNTDLVTIIGLDRTSAAPNIRKAATAFGLSAIDDPAPEENLFDRSDNVHFARKGIPAPTFSLGFDAFDDAINKYYHQPGDEADTLDYEYLSKFFSAYVYSGRLLGNDPVTPFWTAGDSYEEAGKALYNK